MNHKRGEGKCLNYQIKELLRLQLQAHGRKKQTIRTCRHSRRKLQNKFTEAGKKVPLSHISMDPAIFKQVLDNLFGKHPDCDIIVNLTAAGGIANSEDDRLKPFMTLKPEMASFDCTTMNWMHTGVFNNNPSFLMRMGTAMQEVHVKPEVEVFNIGDIWEAKWYRDKGYLKDPVHFQFCMGCAGGIPATAECVIQMRNALREAMPGSTWSAFGTGKGAMEVLYTAIAAGGNVRVGMEDNVVYKKGQLAESNMQLIARARRCIEDYGLEVATPDEARQILDLK